MNTLTAIATLVDAVPRPDQGLPDEVFYYISRTTPLVNVDLLIRDAGGRTLLAWRSDQYAGTGWHIPGGIVRFRETLETRVKKVAATEIGTAVDFDPEPIAVSQMINPGREVRGHFISLLYSCRLDAAFEPEKGGRPRGTAGYLMWHETCPENLIPYHEVYRKYIDEARH